MSTGLANLALAAAVATCAAACGGGVDSDPRADTLRRAVEQTHRLLEKTRSDPMAAAALQNAAESGGSALHYVIASLPDDSPQRCFSDQAPRAAWCVVLKAGPGEHQVTVEGYGDPTAAPLIAKVATVAAMRR